MTDERELLKDLVVSISDWIEGGRGRSLSSLARRCNVAYSTIRRIAQNESTPNPYTALAICEITMSNPEKLEFLKKHFPIIGSLMNKRQHFMPKDPNEKLLSGFLSKEVHNRIFNMAATIEGTSRKAIRRLAGDIGIQALDEMVDAGLLHNIDGDKVKYSHDTWWNINVDYLLRQIKTSTQHFDKSLIGTDGACLAHLTGSISKESVPELKKLILKFIEEFNILKNNPNSDGGVHFFCDLIYSLYDKEELNTER